MSFSGKSVAKRRAKWRVIYIYIDIYLYYMPLCPALCNAFSRKGTLRLGVGEWGRSPSGSSWRGHRGPETRRIRHRRVASFRVTVTKDRTHSHNKRYDVSEYWPNGSEEPRGALACWKCRCPRGSRRPREHTLQAQALSLSDLRSRYGASVLLSPVPPMLLTVPAAGRGSVDCAHSSAPSL